MGVEFRKVKKKKKKTFFILADCKMQVYVCCEPVSARVELLCFAGPNQYMLRV